MDSLFESMFESFADQLIEDKIMEQFNKDISEIELKVESDLSNSESNIKVSEIKDITNNDKESQGVVLSTNSDSENKKDDKIQTSNEKKKQIKDEAKKQTFVKICKFVFYLITIFTIFVVSKKLLQLAGIISDTKVEASTNVSDSNLSDIQSFEMSKTNNIKTD